MNACRLQKKERKKNNLAQVVPQRKLKPAPKEEADLCFFAVSTSSMVTFILTGGRLETERRVYDTRPDRRNQIYSRERMGVKMQGRDEGKVLLV